MSQMSGLREKTPAKDRPEAKQWCNEARKILGDSDVASENLSQQAMRANLALTSLASLTGKDQNIQGQLSKQLNEYDQKYRELGGQAHAIEQDKDMSEEEKKKALRQIAEDLDVLREDIRKFTEDNTSNGNAKLDQKRIKQSDIDAPERQKVDQLANEITSLYPEYAKVVPPEQLQSKKIEINKRIGAATEQARRDDDYRTAQGTLTIIKGDMDKALTEARIEAGKWKEDLANFKKEWLSKLDEIPELNLHGYNARNALDLAERTGNTFHVYDEARVYLEDCRKAMQGYVEWKTKIDDKINAFKERRKELDKRILKTSEQLDLLSDALHNNRMSRKLVDGGPADYMVTASIGSPLLGKLNSGYMDLFNKIEWYEKCLNDPDAWSSYPGDLDNLDKALARENEAFENLIAGKKSKEDKVGALAGKAQELVDDFNNDFARKELEQKFALAKQTAQEQLMKLEHTLGPLCKEFVDGSKTLTTTMNDFAKDPKNEQVEALLKLAEDSTQAVKAGSEERNKLLREYLQLNNRYQEASSIWGKLWTQQSYLDGIKKELDLIDKVYISSNSIETIRQGIEKTKVVVQRFEEVMKSRDALDKSVETGNQIKKLLESAELKTYQSTALAALSLRYEELAKVVGGEDPKTLQPKLDTLKSDIEKAQQTALAVKKKRETIAGLPKTLRGLFDKAATEMAKGNPDPQYLAKAQKFGTSFEAEVKVLVQFALSLEDESKLNDAEQKILAVKKKLDDFGLLNDEEVKKYYKDTESKHIKGAVDEDDKQTKTKDAYEKALEKFTNTTYPDCEKKLNPGRLARLLGKEGADLKMNQLKAIQAKRDEAVKLAEEKKYDEALTAVTTADIMAQQLSANPDAPMQARSLKPLGADWANSVTNLQNAITEMLKAVRESCEAIDKEKAKGVMDKLTAACGKLSEEIKADEFNGFLNTLSKSADKTVATQALQLVRKRLAFVQTNPLLLKLAANQFGINIPSAPMLKTLQALETNLLTV